MDWDFLFNQLIKMVVPCLIVVGGYYGAKEYVNYYRHRSKTKATAKEVVLRIFTVLGFCVFLAAFITNSPTKDPHRKEYFVAYLAISALPSLFGLLVAFENDSKLTNDQRGVRKALTKMEDDYLDKEHDGRY